MRDYKRLFAIFKKFNLDKSEAVLQFTNGRTDSLKLLSDAEFNELLRTLASRGLPPGDAQRKKLIAMAKAMQWGADTKAAIAALNRWLFKQKYRKTLMQLSPAELGAMITIMEKVYKQFLTSLTTS